MFIQSVFITETNNYTKRILQSHTDHFSNIRAMNWKKLTTEVVNRFIACHGSTQMKNKSHVLVRKTHHSIVRSSVAFPSGNFQLNLPCFHMTAKKDFATVLDACWRSVVFITPPPIWPRKTICCIGGRVAQTASLDTVEKRKITCPYQHSKLWQANQGLFPNWLCYPSSCSNQ